MLPVLPVLREQRDALRPEVVFLAQLGQQRHVAGGPVAEPEVVPHHDPAGVQPVGQHGPDELIRSQPGEVEREGQHADRVAALGAQQLHAAADAGQQRGVRAGPDHLNLDAGRR